MDWDIQLCYDKNLDGIFINKFFNFLESKGAIYNAGSYIINETNINEKPIVHLGKDINGSSDNIEHIIAIYNQKDLKSTQLSIDLDYLSELNFSFWVHFVPQKNKCIISFGTTTYLVPDKNRFLSFINLCRDVFIKFNFNYGSFRNEYQDPIPLEKDEFLKEPPNIVNFYSKSLVDTIGCNKLLSTPAYSVEELENGGIMVIVCTNQLGCDNMDDVWHHLGY
jgi:hypothetical protein